jgi:hypothetical protein
MAREIEGLGGDDDAGPQQALPKSGRGNGYLRSV